MRPHCHAGIAGPRDGRGTAAATEMVRPEHQAAEKAVSGSCASPMAASGGAPSSSRGSMTQSS
jgi:hypothetical protein